MAAHSLRCRTPLFDACRGKPSRLNAQSLRVHLAWLRQKFRSPHQASFQQHMDGVHLSLLRLRGGSVAQDEYIPSPLQEVEPGSHRRMSNSAEPRIKRSKHGAGDARRRDPANKFHQHPNGDASENMESAGFDFLKDIKERVMATGATKQQTRKTAATRKEIGGELTEEQRAAVEAVQSGKNVFLTGSAGTGKSFVLRHMIRALRKKFGKGVHVTASTGAAAVLIGGTTLHAFAGIGLGRGDPNALVKKVMSNKLTVQRWKHARALIIDEISMIECELFDKVDYVARHLKDVTRPFGGIQLVLCGDFFQLPPVTQAQSKFAFEARAWAAAVHRVIELSQVMRQGEDGFVRILNELRWGKVSAASAAALLSCAKHRPEANATDMVVTKLYPYNVNVRAENEKRLNQLPGETVTFVAEDVVRGRAHQRSRLEAIGVEKHITLKKGAQVMCLKNLDVTAGLVNGARGVVVGFEQNATAAEVLPVVKFACGVRQTMTRESWSVRDHDQVVAERKQIPLQLAWAVSVHKCQGMTLDLVQASLSQAFDHGMVYVALSRVRSLAGLRLLGFDTTKVSAHPAVVKFYRGLGCAPPDEVANRSGGVLVAQEPDADTLTEVTMEEVLDNRSHPLLVSRRRTGGEEHGMGSEHGRTEIAQVMQQLVEKQKREREGEVDSEAEELREVERWGVRALKVMQGLAESEDDEMEEHADDAAREGQSPDNLPGDGPPSAAGNDIRGAGSEHGGRSSTAPAGERAVGAQGGERDLACNNGGVLENGRARAPPPPHPILLESTLKSHAPHAAPGARVDVEMPAAPAPSSQPVPASGAGAPHGRGLKSAMDAVLGRVEGQEATAARPPHAVHDHVMEWRNRWAQSAKIRARGGVGVRLPVSTEAASGGRKVTSFLSEQSAQEAQEKPEAGETEGRGDTLSHAEWETKEARGDFKTDLDMSWPEKSKQREEREAKRRREAASASSALDFTTATSLLEYQAPKQRAANHNFDIHMDRIKQMLRAQRR